MSDRREIWRRTIVVSLAIPEDTDHGFALPCVNIEVIEAEREWPAYNSTKVDHWDEAVASILCDLVVYLQRQAPAIQPQLDRSLEVRRSRKDGGE